VRDRIPPSSARSFRLSKGSIFKIIDPLGHQVSDFVAFSFEDVREKFDQPRTRINNWTNLIGKGSLLYSNRNEPLLEVVEDDVGIHDILFPCCNSYVYEKIMRSTPRKGCFENLRDSLAQFGIKPDDIPNPLNVFMNTFLDVKSGNIGIGTAPSKSGDSFSMRALKELIVASTACADDISDCNAKKCKPIEVEIVESD